MASVLALAPHVAWAQPAPQDSPVFDIFEYQVEGNSALSPLAIERAVYPHLGEKRRIEDVERARASLEKAYRDAGYATVVVDVPVQKVEAGVVILKVTEGRIERAGARGSRYYSRGRIVEQAPSLTEGEVPYFPAVQADINRLNRSPDRRVTPVLRAGTLPGTTEIELKVDDHLPLHGGVELNNRYSPNTTKLRLSGNLRYDNLFQRDHSAGMQFQTSPEDTHEVRVLLLNYSVPLPQSGGTLFGYYVRSRSNVAAVGDVTVLGNGEILGLRAAWPLAAAAGYSPTLTLGADAKVFHDTVTQPGTPGIQTPIRYLPFSVDYGAAHQGTRDLTRLNAGAVFSLRNVGNNPEDFANKRFKASPNFLALRWGAERTQALGRLYSLYLRAEGQLANEPLISNEQFFAGGLNSVRGYLESEAIGDEGVRLSGELRGPSLAPEGSRLTEARPFVFIEGAHLTVMDPLPGQRDKFTLSSAGLGLRARIGQGLDLSLNVAWPFKETLYTKRHEARGQFSAAYRF